MPRVAIIKSTGALLEYQSGVAPSGTLLQNAINAGFNAADIEEKVITDAELQVLFDVINVPAVANAEREQKIEDEIRKGPIQALIARGEITP